MQHSLKNKEFAHKTVYKQKTHSGPHAANSAAI